MLKSNGQNQAQEKDCSYSLRYHLCPGLFRRANTFASECRRKLLAPGLWPVDDYRAFGLFHGCALQASTYASQETWRIGTDSEPELISLYLLRKDSGNCALNCPVTGTN